MNVVIGLVVGMFGGFLFIRKQMDQRLYMILSKTGIFNEEQLAALMSHYRNYNKILKEARKRYKEAAIEMETKYLLDQDKKSQKL